MHKLLCLYQLWQLIYWNGFCWRSLHSAVIFGNCKRKPLP